MSAKTSNGDGTSDEKWLCGCVYTSDDDSGRILRIKPCKRHAEPQETP